MYTSNQRNSKIIKTPRNSVILLNNKLNEVDFDKKGEERRAVKS